MPPHVRRAGTRGRSNTPRHAAQARAGLSAGRSAPRTQGKFAAFNEFCKRLTEKEYRYAQSRNIPILSFLHGELGAISADKTERDESKRVKLETFRASLSSGRLVKYWRSKEELTLQVTQALQYVARTRP